jgi:pimeloyl-ACP methyl ester carboxylesterase
VLARLAAARLPVPFVPRDRPPNREGVVRLGGRRCLGWAEYGDPDGDLVLWCHGTPGARRQVPPVGRRAAEDLGLRIVCVERPGVGSSTGHKYATFAEFGPDAAAVADDLGHERFAVVGLSGGGPYAVAAGWANPDRVTAVGVLGGVCPLVGDDAGPGGGLVGMAVPFQWALEPIRVPMGVALWSLLQPIMPLGHAAYLLVSRVMPEGDRKVFADPEIEAMFIGDIVQGSALRFGAIAHDVALFGRHWGFELGDVRVPVRWWHGDTDSLVPLEHAEQAVSRIPDCELRVRPGESHLGGFAAADEVLETLRGISQV